MLIASVSFILGAGALDRSREYLRARPADARDLRKQITFRFTPNGCLHAAIYDQQIVIDPSDGSGCLTTRGVTYMFAHVDQAIACILASHW